MSFLKNRFLRRFGPVGRVADAAIVGNAAIRMAKRQGIITEETAQKFGAPEGSGGKDLSIAEAMLIVGASWRLLRRMFSGRKDKRIIIDV